MANQKVQFIAFVVLFKYLEANKTCPYFIIFDILISLAIHLDDYIKFWQFFHVDIYNMCADKFVYHSPCTFAHAQRSL